MSAVGSTTMQTIGNNHNSQVMDHEMRPKL